MAGLLHTLWRPDQEEDPELSVVARAANILQVGEFQLLQLAYEDWYGEAMPAELCDKVFRAYMLHNEVPSWARHYARWVIRQDEIDAIDSNDTRFHRYDHNYVTHVPRGMRKFLVASMLLAFVFVSAILAGELAQVQVSSVLPPYFEEKELVGGDR